jgi:Sulfotransferase family
MMAAVVRIADVSVDRLPPDHLHGADIEVPRPGATRDTYSFEVEGWVVGNSAPVERIEVLQEGRVILDFPPNLRRPDIDAKFPAPSDIGASGFRTSVGTLSLRSKFEISIRVRLESGRHVRLGTIEGERQEVNSDYEPFVEPLMVNTIGRSGSTWLTWLLNCHPEVVAFKPFEHETRVASYWVTAFQELSQPQSFLTQLDPPDLAARRWWLGEAGVNRGALKDEEVSRWLGYDNVRALAAICQSRIDAFYCANTAMSQRERYFVEKFSPWQVVPDLLSELYPNAKELILVRDFRDMFCSIRSFNAKRGVQGFGRDRADGDRDYIETMVRGFANAILSRWRQRASAAHLVRYEDLVLDPAGTLRQLLDYLGLDDSDAVVDRTLELAEDASGSVQHMTAGKPAASIGRWRRDLSEELQLVCQEALDPVLAQLGYESTAERATEPV